MKEPGERAYAIVNGQRINNIVNIQAMGNGSLVAFTIDRKTREERMVVKTEDIELIEQVKKKRSSIRLPSSW